ncbi:MAG TPA: winged helix DNA-binding protein, partial [Chitinophagaceae bacterium]|nr:winged helix DNA-binding protein [Chitinophagaceae bacterium]
RMLHKESDVSRLVDRLVNLGLVEKKENETNKRKIFICLSPEGHQLAESIDVNDDGFRSIMKTLSQTDILMFNKLVHKLLATQL